MSRTFTHTFDRDDETGVVVTYTATGGHSGNTFGLPEDCEPPEAPEIEIVSAETSDGQPVTLTEAETERMSTWLAENHEDDDFYDDRGDWDD